MKGLQMGIFRKVVSILIVLLTAYAGTWAAPALKGVFTVKQPDGTLIGVEQHGDEHCHWTTTEDGALVVNKGGAYYIAEIDDAGELKASGLLAHAPSQRDGRERQEVMLQSSRMTLFHQHQERMLTRAAQISDYGGYLPHNGSPLVLTILAEFQDSAFTVNSPVQAFEQYLNGYEQVDLGNKNHQNIAGVRQYFDICSQGQFTPQFDLVGPVKLPREMAYYGDRFYTFCKDAVTQAKSLVPDWTVYDNDGDGNVELVCIIFAGYGRNQGGGEETIWAKASRQDIRMDDIKINFFNCSPEHFYPVNTIDAEGVAMKDYINGTGVFVHEMSHCMGLPDLYQTYGILANDQGMESWDVMDYGLYNRNSFAPAAYTAWELEAMGWTEIEAVEAPQHLSGLQPLTEGGKAYKIVNSADEDEYIVMENIVKRGLNSYAYGSGLLVYHMAYPCSDVNMVDKPNNEIGRPCVAVVPACGTLLNAELCGSGKEYTKAQWRESMGGSVFPGLDHVTELTDNMHLPNYLFYDGDDATTPVGVSLHHITETEEGISLDLAVDDPEAIQPVRNPQPEAGGECYDLLGRSLGSHTPHGFGIYIDKQHVARKVLKK